MGAEILIVGIVGLIAAGASRLVRVSKAPSRGLALLRIGSEGGGLVSPGATHSLYVPPAPSEVTRVLGLLERGQAHTSDVRRAAQLAAEVGLGDLAESLDARAEVMAEVDSFFGTVSDEGLMDLPRDDDDEDADEDVREEEDGGGDAAATPAPTVSITSIRTVTSPSPINEATDAQWSALVSALATGARGAVNADDKTLGRWRIDYRQLMSLGLVERKGAQGAAGYVWLKIGNTPVTERSFLDDEGAQYAVLERILLGHYHGIIEEWQGQIGGTVDSKPISLSGLLGLARKAGISGMAGWLCKPEDRAKFTKTGEAFDRTNGIF